MFRSLPRATAGLPSTSTCFLRVPLCKTISPLTFPGQFFLLRLRRNLYDGYDTSARDTHHHLRIMHHTTWLMQYALLRRSFDLFLLRQVSMYGTSTGQSGMERCQHTVRL